jgi:D-alanyl-D-alanine carboxypeptidase (penicillin-binding protein 5/6)
MPTVRLAVFPFFLAFSALLFSPAHAAPFDTTANFAVLMDAQSGDILFEKRSDELMAPASMAKLMTLAVAFERLKEGGLKLDDTFKVSEKAWRMQGSRMFVLVDNEVRIEDLLRGIIVQSGNDACIVIAEGIAGSEERFAQMMTDYARRIGMEKSIFTNSTGWPDEKQRMTARELAVLARHLVTEYPDNYRYFGEKEFVWNNIRQPNRNPLLFEDIGADGLKTGHTEESGYGLVASAVRDKRRLVLVINGLNSEKARAEESRRLIDWGFREFTRYNLFAKGETVDTAPVWGGTYARVPLVAAANVSVLMRRSERKNMKVSVHYNAPLPAPVTAGTKVGILRVGTPEGPTREFALLAGGHVERADLFSRGMTALGTLLLKRDEATGAAK